jgi:excisionase family DNA binding protein
MPNLISIEEFKSRYGCSRSTVIRLNERGLLPFIKFGRNVRIRTEDAEAWFASLPVSASGRTIH